MPIKYSRYYFKNTALPENEVMQFIPTTNVKIGRIKKELCERPMSTKKGKQSQPTKAYT